MRNPCQIQRLPELEAEIYYLTTEEGGRRTPVENGYRGQFYYNGKDWDAPQQFIDKEVCNLGESVRVKLYVISTDYHVGQFSIGQEFETREGSKTVGRGIITKILRPDFNYWDGTTFLKSLGKSLSPYKDNNDLSRFRADVEYSLTQTGFIDNIEFEMTGSLECMMLVKCRLRNTSLASRNVADEIISRWKTEIAQQSHLYKVALESKSSIRSSHSVVEKFVLTFATWHSMYITGQIIVTG